MVVFHSIKHILSKHLLFFVSSILFWTGITFAPSALAANNTEGLTLSPVRKEISISPGTSVSGALTVTNSTDKSMTVDFNSEKFGVVNEQYDYVFTKESELSKWIIFDIPRINLTSHETRKITFTVNVPLSAEPGGRYISLFATTDATSSSSAIKSRQRIASLLYITVLGDIRRTGSLVALNYPWLIVHESNWSAEVQNKGTTHFRSRYEVNLKSLIGDNSIGSVNGDALILPGTVRAIQNKLPTPRFPGVYRMVFNIGLGDSPATTLTRYVLYMPWWASVILVALIIIGVTFITRKIIKKRQSV